jgi:hypothetical protein
MREKHTNLSEKFSVFFWFAVDETNTVEQNLLSFI